MTISPAARHEIVVGCLYGCLAWLCTAALLLGVAALMSAVFVASGG